jgi:hypothetical protein
MGQDGFRKVIALLDMCVPQGRGQLRSRSHRNEIQEKPVPAGFQLDGSGWPQFLARINPPETDEQPLLLVAVTDSMVHNRRRRTIETPPGLEWGTRR